MTAPSRIPFPHVGGCEGCRAAGVCNGCGAELRGDAGRCTNGRCSRCHAARCTDGGATAPGHGYGASGRERCAG